MSKLKQFFQTRTTSFFESMIEARQRQANREIAVYLANSEYKFESPEYIAELLNKKDGIQ